MHVYAIYALGTRYFGPSTWYQALGTNFSVPYSWRQMLGTKCLVPNISYQLPDTQYKVCRVPSHLKCFVSRMWCQVTIYYSIFT